MRAITFHGPEDVRVEDVPAPDLVEPSDALVGVDLTGICGSDLHVYHGEIPGVLPGTVLGHEFVGTVLEAGSDVRRLDVGERVVGAFHVACGSCRACRRRDFHQCDRGGVYGYGVPFGDLAGAQAQAIRVPWADVNLRRLPEAIPDASALFAGDVLTTAFGAVRKAGLSPGETCAVVGCGPVGLMVVECAFLFGAAEVYAVDLLDARVALAAERGAVPVPSDRVHPVSRVQELTDGEGADVVVEAVGSTETLELAFDLVRGGGRISAVGVTAEETFDYPLMSALVRDVRFRAGLANVHRDLDAVLALLAGGRIDPSVLVSDRLPLSEGPEGYRRFSAREATKVVLEP